MSSSLMLRVWTPQSSPSIRIYGPKGPLCTVIISSFRSLNLASPFLGGGSISIVIVSCIGSSLGRLRTLIASSIVIFSTDIFSSSEAVLGFGASFNSWRSVSVFRMLSIVENSLRVANKSVSYTHLTLPTTPYV